MMTMQHVEKSQTRRGEYVGYGAGLVWRVYRDRTSGIWYGTVMDNNTARLIAEKRLRDIDATLAKMSPSFASH